MNHVQIKERLIPGDSFRFSVQELGGALGDLGTLLPLMLALILINGLNATSVLVGVGLLYIGAGLYYRIPIPVQPLKAVAAIAIAFGLSASVIGAAGIIMGIILLLLSLTNLVAVVVKLFPQAVVRGIQLAVGVVLLKKGIELCLGNELFIIGASSSTGLLQLPMGILLAAISLLIFILLKFVFVRQGQRFPPSLVLVVLGLAAGAVLRTPHMTVGFGPATPNMVFPNIADFWVALTMLVIPQLPLTLGNAVVGTRDTARTYFKDQAYRVTPRALSTSMGIANIAAGLFGAMPMCHGSGGLTAHYKMGARTGASNLMIGGPLLAMGVLFGSAALSLLSLIPISVLGILLAIVGVYHALLIRDLETKQQLAVTATVAVATIFLGNLAYGFGAGILLHHLLNLFREDRLHLPKLESRAQSSNRGSGGIRMGTKIQ